MASAFRLRAFLLLQLLQLCLGQYYYNYYNYDYGDYGDDNSWCPFGINGLCVCENDIVDCTGQGLHSVPFDLPATTKQLILKNNKITTIDFTPLVSYNALEVLDLSSNSISALPHGILEFLPVLQTINLSNNPWVCDCNLKWLSLWVHTSAVINSVQFADASATNCAEWPSVSLFSLLPASFLRCASPAPARVLRSVPSSVVSPKPIRTFPNWSSVCLYWFSQGQCNKGPSEAGACVLSSDTLSVSLVHFSTFTAQTDAVACRDYCFSLNDSYHAFENSTYHCLCGNDSGSSQCSDCSSSTHLSSTDLILCQYMRVSDVSHVLSNVDVTFTSPVVTYTPVTFTAAGVPSLVTSLSWTFGDGARQDNASVSTVKHTYTYTGLFLARLELCGFGVCRTVQVRVRVGTQNVLATLTSPNVSDVTKKISVDVAVSNVYSTLVKWTRSSSAGSVVAGGCISGWTAFNDRCFKYLSKTKTFQQAEHTCNQRGGALMRLHNLEEEQQLPSLLGLATSSTAWTGARYNGSVYMWEATAGAAYFLRALTIDRTAGECLVVSVTGLVAASCSSQHQVLCQQDAVPCPVGHQLGSSGLCYYLETTTAKSWQQARSTCQTTHNGDLAVLPNSTLTGVVTTTLGVQSATWMGLTAQELLGHYSWVDGSSLGWTNWDGGGGAPTGVQWPCVSLNSKGKWEPTACDQTLPFVCQYSFNEWVTSEIHVEGTVDLKSNATFQTLAPYTQATPSNAGQTMVLPGVWIAQDGQLLEVNFNMESQSSSNNIVGVQVLRPKCPSGKVVLRPGCKQNVFARCGLPADASSCPSLPTCSSESEHPCFLTGTCTSSSNPCSCASSSTPSSSIDCSATDPDAELQYSLVGEAVFDIPAAGGSFTGKVSGGIDVQTNDILAFQGKESDFGFCQVEPSSSWRRIAFIRVGAKWMDMNTPISLSSYTKQENYVCKVSAVYGSRKTITLPDNLAYFPESDTYTFEAEVEGSGSSPASGSVVVAQEVGDLAWLYPSVTTVSGSSVVYVEAGTGQDLVVNVPKGSLFQVEWQVSTESAPRQGAAQAACPASVPTTVTECHTPTSQLPHPFIVFRDTFSTSTPVSLTLNVSNSLGWKGVSVVVMGMEPIQNLVLYHSNCSVGAVCSPLLEVGVEQQFLTSKSAGSVDVYQFQKNGSVVQSNQTSSLRIVFATSGTYMLSVKASNGLNSMTASMQVSARVRAQVTGVSLEPPSPVSVKTGSNLTITLKVSVSQLAEVTVEWEFGDGQSESSVEQASGDSLDLAKTHIYSAAGSYPLVITLTDPFGVEVKVTSQVHVLSVIGQVNTHIIPRYLPLGNSTSLTISVQSLTSSTPNFGTITYTVNFQDGSAEQTHSSTHTNNTFHHVFPTNGTYSISIKVKNGVGSLSTTTNVFVQECPTAVNLSYSGPKNVSEPLTFTAQTQKGSDLRYEFDFGDGSPVLGQKQSNVAMYTYGTSSTYNASVLVRNAVCSASGFLTVIVMNVSTLVVGEISHDSHVPIKKIVTFTIDVVTMDMQKVSLDWSVQNLVSMTVCNLSLRGTYTFNCSFPSLGTYRVEVKVKLDNGPSQVASAMVTTQEAVSSVSVTAPSLVSFTQTQPATIAVLASATDGTDVRFRWYNSGALLSNQGSNITLVVNTTGVSNISVIAFNEVSSVGAWTLVDVQHTIENVVITCPTCIGGQFVRMQTSYLFNCTYLGMATTVAWTVGTVTIQESSLNHSFTTTGLQTLRVNVSNLVSSQDATFEVVVEEAVSVLSLGADKTVSSEGGSILLTASHTQGTAVVYTWACGSQAPYKASSPTTHVTFNSWGLYTCLVTAANNVSSEQSSVDIQVLESITSLGVKNLTAGSTLYVPVGREAGQEADCNTYFAVNFTWIIMKAGAVLGRVDGPRLTHTFLTVGSYDLQLDAVSAIDSLSVSVVVQALEEISNLRASANDTSLVVGAGVQLTATIDAGTSPQFAWTVDGMPLSSVSGLDSFPYSFNSPGSYLVSVNASNSLNFLVANVTVLVQYPVQNTNVSTSIDMAHPYVSQYTKLTFHSSVSQGSDPMFHWTVQSPISKHTHITTNLRQNFVLTGDYYFQLLVSNAVSQENETFVIHVERAITSLTLTVTPSAIVATNTALSFVGAANSDATPVIYSWTIDGQTYPGSSQTVSLAAAGIYPVKLTVHNNISSLEKTKTLEVQDPVTGLQMSDCNVTRQSGAASTLSGSAHGTNISFSWIVQLPTQNRTSLGPSLTLVFPTGGIYPVHLLAGNKVEQETLTCTVRVQDVVANVAVHLDDPPVNYIFTNQNVTFSVTGDYLTDAEYTWEFVGLATVKSHTPSHTRTFTSAQTVTLALTAANNISRMTVSVSFTVQDLQCNLPKVTAVGVDSRTALRSQTPQFDVYIDNKGCVIYAVTHTWRIYDIKDCTQVSSSTAPLTLTSVKTDAPTLRLPASALPATKQNFCIEYTLGYERTPVAERVGFSMTVLSTLLVAIIGGGGWRQVDGSTQVCLDGSLSYNPDLPTTGSAGMIFAWVCQTVSGSGTCFQPVTNSSGMLCVNSLTTGTYNITLTVVLSGSPQATHSTSQMLEVWITTPPILSVGVRCVSCRATGDYRISSNHHLVLSAQCDGCTASQVSYAWTVTKDGGTAVSLGSADTSTGSTSANLVILRNKLLKDGSAYTFMVTVDTADGSRTQGKAYITLPPNHPPSGGACTATPDSITPLQESVTVSCSGWSDANDPDSQLLYEIKAVQGSQRSLLYYGVRSTQTVYLAPWPGSSNTGVDLVVSVMDLYGARTIALSKSITFKDSGIPAGQVSQQLYLSANATLTTLLQQGDPVPLLQYSLALTHMLNSASTTGTLSTSDLAMQSMVRAAILVCVSSRVTVETTQQVQQMAYLLQELTEYSAEYQTSGSHTLILQSLQSMTTTLKSSVRQGMDRNDFAFQHLYSTILHTVKSFSSSSSSSPTSLDNTFPQFNSLRTVYGTSVQSLDFSTAGFSATHQQDIVTRAFSEAETLTSTVLQAVVLGEEGVSYQDGGMEVDGKRTTVGELGSYVELGGSRFNLPAAIFAGSSSSEEILKIVMMMEPNPFTWGYIDQHSVNTQVPLLSFKRTDGTDLSIRNLTSAIEILMFDSDGTNYTVTNGSLLHNPHYDPLAKTVFETWMLGKGQSKKLEIDAKMGSSQVSGLHIMVRVQAMPNLTDQASGLVPSATIQAYLGAGFEASADSYTAHKEITTALMAAGVDHRLYTFFVSSQDFSDSREYSITLINEDSDHEVNISSTIYISSCQFYDKAQRVWSAAGCSVSEESIPMATVCHSNHLTAFGGSSLVPLSSIQFSDLATLELGLNPVTLIAVCSLLLVYVVGVGVCRHWDRADLRRISMVPLCGRDGACKYHVTVITGRQIGAGTSAHIGIKLYGESGKSEARHLTKSSAFQRNSRDTFLIASDKDLGLLHKMRVWHDNTGSSPAWYLTQIQVQDFQSGQRHVFPANTWLSLEQEDGTLQTELRVADDDELHSFSRVFRAALANSMAERHMWLSIFNRPDHSRFTRVQRITCCVTLVYLYMFLNAMWYGLIKDQSEARDSVSWKVIGWEEVLIALVSVGCIFPVAMLLVCIFKRSRSKADVFTQAMRPQSAQTLEIDAMCDVSQYGGSLRTMTPNEDWSTIFERESTTESIPPISSQLRRTTAVSRSSRDFTSHGSFPGSGKKSAVQVIRRTQDLMWNQENILKSWPEKLPSFAEEEKEKDKSPNNKAKAATSSAAEDTAVADESAAPVASTSGSSAKAGGSGSGTAAAKISETMSMTNKRTPASSLKKTNSLLSKGASGQFVKGKGGKVAPSPPPPPPPAPAAAAAAAKGAVTTRKTASFKMDQENDSDEEFMQKLNQIDQELKKSSSIRSRASMKGGGGLSKGLVKKHSSHSSQGAIEDMFESDDDWASEGMEGRGAKKVEGAAFNPRQPPGLDRRASVTSLMRLRLASMHVPSSAGSSMLRRDSTFMHRDSIYNSFLLSEKSRTTLSTRLKNHMQLLGSLEEDRGCRLPWFCVYVGYGLCVALCVVSVLMVLLYGYNFGSAIALQWLLSVLLAFLGSLVVLEPLKVVLLALYVAIVVKDAEKDEESDSIDVMPSVEANEQLKEVKFRPLGGFALLQAHKEGRKKIRLRTMIRQTVTYLLLTATVLVVANVYFGPDLHRATDHMENSFLYTGTAASSAGSVVSFYHINSTDTFWMWARETWVPALFRQDLVSSEENPLLLGPARLRQIRSTTVDCLTDEVEKVRSCVGRLEFTEDTAAYSSGWLNTSAGNASWVHSSAEQLHTWSKFGQDLLYSGGGYVQDLGTSYNQTLSALQQLDAARWLDRSSRALFMEWTSYSAGEDLFCAVTLLLEFPISGGVLASHIIQTQRLYVYNPSRLEPLYVCQVVMLLPLLYLLIQSGMTLKEQKGQFAGSPGNWLQATIALLGLASVGAYIACVLAATDAMERFSGSSRSASSSSFTDFERAAHLHDVLRVLHACLLFLLFLKIAGQVRFLRPLSVYPRTLATASTRLLGATFLFLLLLLIYTQLGYLLYGSALHGYRSFQSALLSMFGVMKGRVDLTPELEHHPIFTHFFFYSFYAFVYGLFVAFVIAILQDAYRLTRSQMVFKSSLEPQDYEMIEFMLKRFKLWAGITKPKPAFRRVQFEGQPSLPSRGSSSATSSRRSPSQNSMERGTPTPDLLPSPSNMDALDRLIPAWERMLSLLGTVEGLDEDEQKQVGRVQIACSCLTSDQEDGKKSAASKKNPQGKPPLNPKSKFSRFQLNFQNSNNDQTTEPTTSQRQAFTPPPSSKAEGSTNIMMRTLSDQGAGSFGLPERPASESRKARPSSSNKTGGVQDAFPGSSSQRSSRQSGGSARTEADSTAGSSSSSKGVPSASSADTPPRRGAAVKGTQPSKVADSATATADDDSKKKAWEDKP